MFISFIDQLFNNVYMNMQFCICKCIDINTGAYGNKSIKNVTLSNLACLGRITFFVFEGITIS